MRIYKLICGSNTKIRIGRFDRNDTDDIIHSDTLFSAIITCFNLLYGDEKIQDFINEFENGNIKLSSVFYLAEVFKKNDSNEFNFLKTIRFVPKPFINISLENSEADEELVNRKKIKKLKFISEKVFTDIIGNFNGEVSNFDLKKDKEYIKDEFCYDKSELNYSFKSSFKINLVEYKNSIDRETNNSIKNESPFTELDICLNDIFEGEYLLRPHLYFYVDINPDFEKEFNTCIRLMCDEGLGGERSFGKGTFQGVEIYDSDLEINSKVNINLSLKSTDKEEIKSLKNTIVSYDSMVRSGWINDSKKKSVRMIKEGSVFKSKLSGQIADLTPSGFTKNKTLAYGKGIIL